MSADGTLTAIESLQHSSAGGVAIRGDHSDAGSPSDSSDDGKMAVPVSLTAATAAAAAAAAAEEAQSPTGAAKAEAITILLGAGMAEDEALTALDATARYLSTAAGASAGDGGLTEETVDLDDNSTAFEWADAAQLWAMMHQSEEVVDVEAAADSRALDEARIASLEQADTERAAQKPLAEWTDADLVARFIASKMLPLLDAACGGSVFHQPLLRAPAVDLLDLELKCRQWYPGPESAQYFVSLAEGALAGMPSRAGDSATEEVAGAACGDWGGMPHNGSVSGDTQHAGNGIRRASEGGEEMQKGAAKGRPRKRKQSSPTAPDSGMTRAPSTAGAAAGAAPSHADPTSASQPVPSCTAPAGLADVRDLATLAEYLKRKNMESREAVFAMPEEAGQVPAIFASTAVADESGNVSDCEILEVMKAPCMPAPFVL